jgi:hypothetical protein
VSEASSALEQFRARVFRDGALQDSLGRIADPEAFAREAEAAARSFGIALSRETVAAALKGSGAGMPDGPAQPVTDVSWPPAAWLPTQAALDATGGFRVDWSCFGTEPLDAPFFDIAARDARNRPLNRLLHCRLSLADFVGHADYGASLRPAGFIFHMSRCGSTLAARVLACDPAHVVISEAPPLDAVMQMNAYWPDIPVDDHGRCLAAMVAALGRRRLGRERHYFLKLDSWHTLALPLIRRVFPDTPWVFLYRDPLDVLVSQMRQRGLQTVPGAIPGYLFGIDADQPGEDYCAQVLAKTCEAVMTHWHLGGGLLVNYDELPDAVWTRMLPHFGVAASDVESLRAVALTDAKQPHRAFASDSADKRRDASDAIRAAAARYISPVYEALEAIRMAQSIL